MRKIDERKLQMEESFQRAIDIEKKKLKVLGILDHFDFELVYIPRYLLVKQAKGSSITETAFRKMAEDNRLKTDVNG